MVRLGTKTEGGFDTSPQVAERCTFLLMCPNSWLAPECQHLLWDSWAGIAPACWKATSIAAAHISVQNCPHRGAASLFSSYRHHTTTTATAVEVPGNNICLAPWPCVHVTGSSPPLLLPCPETEQSRSMKMKNWKFVEILFTEMRKTSVMLEPSLASRGVLAASPESHCPMLHPCISKSTADLPPKKQNYAPLSFEPTAWWLKYPPGSQERQNWPLTGQIEVRSPTCLLRTLNFKGVTDPFGLEGA